MSFADNPCDPSLTSPFTPTYCSTPPNSPDSPVIAPPCRLASRLDFRHHAASG
jgi:hypothetical protein